MAALAILYVVLSSYYILDTRVALATFEAAQQESMEKLAQRQEIVEYELKLSNEALAQRLGMGELELHQRMQARATDLLRQQQALERVLQDQQLELRLQDEQKEQVAQK